MCVYLDIIKVESKFMARISSLDTYECSKAYAFKGGCEVVDAIEICMIKDWSHLNC